MGAIVTSLRPGFRLAKLEGDAAFTFAITERIDGSLLLDTIERCYFGFRRRRRDVRQATSCECQACVRIPDLDLKFVVHHGPILRQRVAGRQELLGSDVIVAHRLLKNDVVATTGVTAYALFTQSCVDAMDVDVAAIGMQPTSETYEHIGAVQAWVHDLGRRWAEEESRTRVHIDDSAAIKSVSLRTSAPPQVAWEFVTTPGRRILWQVGVTGVQVTAVGDRRGVGATTHCLHGKEASIEELLDWRPYDYFTLRNTIPTPMGSVVRILETTEFEPTPDGTVIHWRFGPPGTAKELGVLRQMDSFLDQAMEVSGRTLQEQLEAELARRGGDAAPEPELPLPRPDGPFAGVGTSGQA
jgi:hypothetical protein